MNDDKLVRMANQLVGFFGAYPDADAAKGISDHLVSFWTPGMRDALRLRIDADRRGVEPLVVRALTALPAAPSAEGVPSADASPGESPIRKEVAGPAALGDLASDAG